MRYRVVHHTSYAYGAPMADGYTVAHLLPRPTAHQRVEHADVTIDPEPDERAERTDAFGNRVLQFGVHRPHDRLDIVAESEVVVDLPVPPAPGEPWEDVAARVRALRGPDALAVRPFAGASPFVDLAAHGAALRALAEAAFPRGRPIVDAARALCAHIFATFEYDPTFTEISTPLSVVLEARRGVCQDFAHLAIGCLRTLGLAARYVSGYIETEPPAGEEALVGAAASHAWCSVWVPGQGWIDFDPTNDHLPTHQHVTVAWGRDYGDVAPVRGVVIGPAVEQRLTVAVQVTRVHAEVR